MRNIFPVFIVRSEVADVLQPRKSVVRGGSSVLGSFNGMLNFVSVLFFFYIRARFSPAQSEREAAAYMVKVIRDSYLNYR